MSLFASRERHVRPGLRLLAEPASAPSFRGRIQDGRVLSGISSFLLPKHEAIEDAPAFTTARFQEQSLRVQPTPLNFADQKSGGQPTLIENPTSSRPDDRTFVVTIQHYNK